MMSPEFVQMFTCDAPWDWGTDGVDIGASLLRPSVPLPSG